MANEKKTRSAVARKLRKYMPVSYTHLHEAEGIHGQLQCLRRGQPAGEQVEAGAAAHGANVDHAVLKGAVACIGGKQMLQRVGGTGGKVIAVIGPFHADVPCENIAVLTAQRCV